jgi:hypothetical protein
VSTLAVAIERKQWELASLCLLMGVVEAAAALPPDAVEGLLEVLAGLEDEDDRQRRGTRSSDRFPGRAGRRGRGRRR